METALALVASSPRTVEAIFKDFSARRAGLVRALTSDVDEFYGFCDPAKENLCLYGNADGSWEVALPAEEVPPELPEPALGINFARDGMNRRDWLSLVAVHSDSWLLSVAFFFGARLNGNERKRLFSMINDLPTVYESMVDRKHRRDRSGVDSHGKSRHSSKVHALVSAMVCSKILKLKTHLQPQLNLTLSVLVQRRNDGHTKNPRVVAQEHEEEDDDDDEEHNETFCGTCGGLYNANEFWIGCDICERWFHGKCVRITPAKADHIKHYKCPDCSSSKKIRQ